MQSSSQTVGVCVCGCVCVCIPTRVFQEWMGSQQIGCLLKWQGTLITTGAQSIRGRLFIHTGHLSGVFFYLQQQGVFHSQV